MDEYLLELGVSDIKATLAGKEEPLSVPELKEMLQAILEVEGFINRIERKGITFREFLAMKNEKEVLPRFQVSLVDGSKFAYSTEELDAIRQGDVEGQRLRFDETLASIPAEEVTPEMCVFTPTRFHFIELYEEDTLEELKNRLARFGFDLTSYSIASKVLIEIADDADQHQPYSTLREVIDFLRINGRKGIEIQRYKGLGEMNADQLWETTMDPSKRTLIKVTLPDAVAADHMFTMLMGEDVPPRRRFIEQYALSVKNLDI
jgi:DNA gyrase subunit B